MNDATSPIFEDDADADRIARFARGLRSHGRRRVDHPLIWKTYQTVYGGENSGVEAREHLKMLLDRLAQDGVCTLPSVKGRAWDRSSAVDLPKWVKVTHDRGDRKERKWRDFPWRPELSWVSQVSALPVEQEEFLIEVQRAIVGGRLEQRAPFKYRSLQLTGDEKRLEAFLKTRLFGPGRLSLQLLNCDGLGLPLTYERVGSPGRMVVFENAGSYMVARRALREMERPLYGMIAYGGGNQVMRTVNYLSEIEGLSEIAYVGDLDAKGIDIGAEFAERVRRLGRFAVVPAAEVHLAMLDASGEMGRPNGWPSKSNRRTSKAESWLAPECLDRVKDIISNGNRIPEEALHGGHYRDIWAGRRCEDI